ncbi:hypothetical protein M0811_06327 [Anaeramoeba ignava]|uniref:Uncharacterized protein n=1 Tax=Anaeramoeba ignava TaxID=1746090 RepID=A0A9Q0LRU3_ANAIG|nr:hypothetical protein M0811_06327 [Anaeramoeba ignava]
MISFIIKTITFTLSFISIILFQFLYGITASQKQSIGLITLEIISSILALFMSNNFLYKIIFFPLLNIVWTLLVTYFSFTFLPDSITKYYNDYILSYFFPVLLIFESIQITRLILFFNRKLSFQFIRSNLQFFFVKIIVSILCFAVASVFFFQILKCSVLDHNQKLFFYFVIGLIVLSLIFSLVSKKRNILDAAMFGLFLLFLLKKTFKNSFVKNCTFFSNTIYEETKLELEPEKHGIGLNQNVSFGLKDILDFGLHPQNISREQLQSLIKEKIKIFFNKNNLNSIIPFVNNIEPVFSILIFYLTISYIPFNLAYSKYFRLIFNKDAQNHFIENEKNASKVAGNCLVRAIMYLGLAYYLSSVSVAISPTWYIAQCCISVFFYFALFLRDLFAKHEKEDY